MAGQRQTVVQESPDHNGHQMCFRIPATVPQRVALFYAEKDFVIESALIRTEALDATNTSLTAVLAKVADGAALTSNTDITSGGALLGSTNGSGLDTDWQEMTMVKSSGLPTENIVKGERQPTRSGGSVTRGETLILEFSDAPAASLGPILLHLRVSHTRQ